jgi:hypothetical protein
MTPYYHLLITIHMLLGTALVNTLDMVLDKRECSQQRRAYSRLPIFRLVMQHQNESVTIPGCVALTVEKKEGVTC